MNLVGLKENLEKSIAPMNYGKIMAEHGDNIEVSGVTCRVGTVGNTDEGELFECVGFKNNTSFFMSRDGSSKVVPGSEFSIGGDSRYQEVPADLLGRVIDCDGVDLLNKTVKKTIKLDLVGKKINPMDRPGIRLPMDVGIKSINGFMSIGRGQRIGIMAGSGVGKSVLLGMITRFTSADIVVVALVGERGREVQDFIDENLSEVKNKCVVVAAPADSSPLKKVRCAELSTSIAEHYRDQGKNVILLMDSITRYANAYRDIYLGSGELPVSRGYPPSVFNNIYSLIERAGSHKNGTITGIYTILVDGDNLMDPIADHCRGIMDGHIVLSRGIADRGVYPAIDISKSISRVMNQVTIDEHQKISRKLKNLYSTYYENKDLISMGYETGSDKNIDLSIKSIKFIEKFLEQDRNSSSNLPESLSLMRQISNHVHSED
jgi:flagellum-specific ATP synthase